MEDKLFILFLRFFLLILTFMPSASNVLKVTLKISAQEMRYLFSCVEKSFRFHQMDLPVFNIISSFNILVDARNASSISRQMKWLVRCVWRWTREVQKRFQRRPFTASTADRSCVNVIVERYSCLLPQMSCWQELSYRKQIARQLHKH